MEDRLAALRHDIDRIDDNLVRLVAERQQLVRQVASIKGERGAPVLDSSREAAVIVRACERAREHGIAPELASALMKLLMSASRALQTDLLPPASSRVTMPSRTIVIVGGCGGMGRWLTHFLGERGHQIRLVDPVPPKITEAQATYFSTLAPALPGAEVIFFATPLDRTAGLIETLPMAQTPALVCDICSLKQPVLEAMARARQQGYRTVSLHPMFGPAVAELAGCTLVIGELGDAAAANEVEALFATSPLRRVRLPATEHDRYMAWILSWAHLANLVFGTALARGPFSAAQLAAIGSTTFDGQASLVKRVSREDSRLYYTIQAANPEVPNLLSTLAVTLADYRKAIETQAPEQFAELMLTARSFWNRAEEETP